MPQDAVMPAMNEAFCCCARRAHLNVFGTVAVGEANFHMKVLAFNPVHNAVHAVSAPRMQLKAQEPNLLPLVENFCVHQAHTSGLQGYGQLMWHSEHSYHLLESALQGPSFSQQQLKGTAGENAI